MSVIERCFSCTIFLDHLFLIWILMSVIERCFSFMIFLDHLFLIMKNIELSLYHSPVNFNKGGIESFFTCAHFCPTYGEVTLQCQNFTFMHGSDDGEKRGQSHEIWYAYSLRCIIVYCIYWQCSVMRVLCIYCILVLTVALSSKLTHLTICRWPYSLHFQCS